MTTFALRPPPGRLRRHPLSRRPHRGVAPDPHLVSVAGAVGARVHDANARLVGVLDEVVVDSVGERHPPVAGVVVRIPHGRTFVPIAAVADIRPHTVLLAGPLGNPASERPARLVALAHEVVEAANGPVFRAIASVCVAAVGMLALAVVLLHLLGRG